MKTIIAVALTALALTACASSYDKETQRDHDFTRSERLLDAAQTNATVNCHDAAQCDEAWQWTKTYVGQRSEEPVTRADALAIESDVPGSSGHATYSATRVAKGGGKPKRVAKKAKAAKPAKVEAVAKAAKPAKKAVAKKAAAKPKSDAASKARAPVTASATTSPAKVAKPVAKKSVGKASG